MFPVARSGTRACCKGMRRANSMPLEIHALDGTPQRVNSRNPSPGILSPQFLRCGLRQDERRISLPGKTRMHLVTQARLDHANYAVTSELDRLGFYDRHVQAVETRLVLFGGPYGWHWSQCPRTAVGPELFT